MMDDPVGWFRVHVRRVDDDTSIEVGGGWLVLAIIAVLLLVFLAGRASVAW